VGWRLIPPHPTAPYITLPPSTSARRRVPPRPSTRCTSATGASTPPPPPPTPPPPPPTPPRPTSQRTSGRPLPWRCGAARPGPEPPDGTGQQPRPRAGTRLVATPPSEKSASEEFALLCFLLWLCNLSGAWDPFPPESLFLDMFADSIPVGTRQTVVIAGLPFPPPGFGGPNRRRPSPASPASPPSGPPGARRDMGAADAGVRLVHGPQRRTSNPKP